MAAIAVAVAAGKTGAVYRYTLPPHTLVMIAVEVTEVGAKGALNNVFVSFAVLLGLLPQEDVYKIRALSPVAAAALLENFMRTIWEVNVPESRTAFVPRVPTKDHCHPVAVPVSAGAA